MNNESKIELSEENLSSVTGGDSLDDMYSGPTLTGIVQEMLQYNDCLVDADGRMITAKIPAIMRIQKVSINPGDTVTVKLICEFGDRGEIVSVG